MSGDDPLWGRVDDYLAAVVGEDDVLVGANRAAAEAGLPAIQVSPAQGKLLHLLALVHGAHRVLEVGTLAGYSTIWLARAVSEHTDGHVTTLELDPRHAAVAEANLARAGLTEVVDVLVGPATESLAALEAAGTEPYDLVFIDADKPSNVRYLEAALRLTGPGAVVVVDNVVRQGGIADADHPDERVRASRAVIDRVAGDPTLTATVIQTVGSKGYDGFLLLRRKAVGH